jgi:Ca-activated chloride channel family protein
MPTHLPSLPYHLSFAAPVVLLALAALPVLLILYVRKERARPRATARFGNPSLMPNLVPRRPRWRRHVAPVVLGLAIAALVVAAARPQRAVSAPKHQVTVILAIDSSKSMVASDVKPTRVAAAGAAARELVDALPADGRVGVVTFNKDVTVLSAPTDDRTVIADSLARLQPSTTGGTSIGDALVQALTLAKQGGSATGGRPPAAIVLLSDGANTSGTTTPLDAARAAKAAHIPVFTISLGSEQGTITDPNDGKKVLVTPDPSGLAQIAQAAGGKTYTVADAAKLKQVYSSIGRRVGTERTVQDMGFAFVGGAGVLVLLAAAASLGWFRRLAG